MAKASVLDPSLIDHFSTLSQPRRPWLDAETLKTKFLDLSTELHPDKATTPAEKIEAERRFASLNQAYSTLRNTRARLLHFLELEGVAKAEHVQNVPAEALKLFPEIAEITKGTDELLKEKAAASSPMLRIQSVERGLEWTEKIQVLQEKIREAIAQIEREVQELDAQWEKGRGPILAKCDQAASALGFLERWNAQLQDRLVALTF